MRIKAATSLFVFVLVCNQTSAQQIPWDAPSFFSPNALDEVGLYLSRVGGQTTGLSGIWRQSGNLNLGVRAGVGDLDKAGESVLVGAEFYGALSSLLPRELAGSWVLGAGAVFSDSYTLFSIPLGATVGLLLGSGRVQIVPYIHPRISLDIEAVDLDGDEQTITTSRVALDIGADVNVGQRAILRLGASLIERDALGMGLALRWPRSVSVR
jgi:hypothetical protein